jgi:preprotein translocase subunit YajC
MQLLMVVAMFALLYFFSIRPQAKRQRAHQNMLAQLTTDDVVVTRGGTVGKVVSATPDTLVLEIQDPSRIQVPRAYVEGKWAAPTAA